MENTLVDMMSNLIELTDEEKEGILEAFPIRTFPKKTFLLKEGQIAKDAFVVIEGCIREYGVNDGEEKTNEFYTKFQSTVNFESMTNSQPSKYYFTCMEDTTVAIMNSEKERALYKKFPRFGEVCRVEMEKITGASQEEFLTF